MSVNDKALSVLVEGLGEIGRSILALQESVERLSSERQPPSAAAPPPGAWAPPAGGGTLRSLVDAYELHVVTEALARHAGNVTRAAAELGVTREGLHKIMRSRGILAEKWRPPE